jgi:hypothetical protein
MSLSDIVNINISAATASPSRPSFGTPLLLAYHTVGAPGRVLTFKSQAEVEQASLPAHVERATSMIFAQNPRPKTVKIGRRGNVFSETFRFTPTVTTAGFVYSLTIDGTTVSVTVQSGDAVADICDDLVAAINATSVTMTATDGTTHVDLASDATGIAHTITGRTPELSVENRTADPGIAADLSAVELEDGDWYALLLDSNSEAEIAAASTWIETREKMLIAQASDSGCEAALTTTDVLSDLAAVDRYRTGSLFKRDAGTFAAAGWAGGRLTADPGSDTWAFKTIRGATADKLTSTVSDAVKAKSGNTYETIAGTNVTMPGVSASGEYLDIVRGIDWLRSEMRVDVFTLLVNNPKLPYTDAGGDAIRSVVQARLDRAADVGLLDPDSIVVTVPEVADQLESDRIARRLPGVEFSARLQGAIHEITINGSVGA